VKTKCQQQQTNQQKHYLALTERNARSKDAPTREVKWLEKRQDRAKSRRALTFIRPVLSFLPSCYLDRHFSVMHFPCVPCCPLFKSNLRVPFAELKPGNQVTRLLGQVDFGLDRVAGQNFWPVLTVALVWRQTNLRCVLSSVRHVIALPSCASPYSNISPPVSRSHSLITCVWQIPSHTTERFLWGVVKGLT